MAFKPPMDIPLSTELHIDYRVLLFTAAVSVLTGVVFGLLPALQATNPDLVPALKDETSIGGYRRSWLRNGLVVFQVSLSLLLLICAGLVLRGLQRAQFLSPGFVAQHAIEMSFDLNLQGYDGARSKQFKRNLLERVRAVTGRSICRVVELCSAQFEHQQQQRIRRRSAPGTRSEHPVDDDLGGVAGVRAGAGSGPLGRPRFHRRGWRHKAARGGGQ